MSSGKRAEDLHVGLMEGAATKEGTARYFLDLKTQFAEYRDHSWFRFQTPSHLALSRIGFGCYRVSAGARANVDALREAILTGVNVIDTAANYSDGSSEQMVGDVIRQLVEAKRIERNQVAVVTKIGYIQGRNLGLLRTAPPPEVVKVRDDIWHCIHPDYIKSQLQLARYRLGLRTIDFLLLHNPEYFLIDAQTRGVPADEARARYVDRLRRAFEMMEEMANRGIIQYYGISSNTLAHSSSSYTATRLDEVLSVAGPRFAAVQFPANLIENDFRYNRSAGGGTVTSVALAHGLWTLGNRPFNANGPRGLIRLARLVDAPPDGGDSGIAEFQKMQGRLMELEAQLHDLFGSAFQFDKTAPAFSDILERYRDRFTTTDQLRASVEQITHLFSPTARRIQTAVQTKNQEIGFNQYLKVVNAVIHYWERYVEILVHQRMEGLENLLGEHPALQGKPLALQVLLILLSGDVPATTLVGMRKIPYVRQLVQVFAEPSPPEREMLSLVGRALDLIEKF
jgi:aryl-alcohol dehydrogenase-like predicted oxidoreductase